TPSGVNKQLTTSGRLTPNRNVNLSSKSRFGSHHLQSLLCICKIYCDYQRPRNATLPRNFQCKSPAAQPRVPRTPPVHRELLMPSPIVSKKTGSPWFQRRYTFHICHSPYHYCTIII